MKHIIQAQILGFLQLQCRQLERFLEQPSIKTKSIASEATAAKWCLLDQKAGIGKPNITTSQPTKSMILPQIHGRPRLRFQRRGIHPLLTLLMERYTSSEDIQKQTLAKAIISTKFTIRRLTLGKPRVRRQCQLSVLLRQSLTITSTF